MKYYENDVILCGVQDDDLPLFGSVDEIIAFKGQAFLSLSLFFTRGIDHHYHSYVVVLGQQKQLFPLNDDNEYLGLLSPINKHPVENTLGTFYVVSKAIVVRL